MWFARFINFINFNISIKKFNFNSGEFKKPAVIISNHISVTDISLFLSLIPRLVIIINNNIRHSKYEWLLKKYANLYQINENIDTSLNFLKDKIDKGYSVLIFPEGIRSLHRIRRFHKGAFMFAEMLKVDILPVFIKADGDFLNKNSFFRHSGKIQLHVLSRISPDNIDFGINYDERTKNICQFYRKLNKELTDKISENVQSPHISCSIPDI